MLDNGNKPREDRRVIRSRRRVQQAFTELLTERDFHKITVQDIAERADINRATFYAHFDDKYALLTYNMRDELQAMLAQRLTQTNKLTRENLRLLAVTVGEFMSQFAGRCHPDTRADQQPMFLILAQVQQYVHEILLGWIGAARTADGDPTQVSPECIAAILSWIMFAGISPLHRAEHASSVESVVDQMMTFLAPSLEKHISGLARAER